MHFALLFGYGANVINPYMAYAAIDHLVEDDPEIKIDADTAERNYIRAAEKGLLKIMSKMGIATIRSYRGCMLFETLGISKEVCDRYLGGTPSSVGGMSLDDIAKDAVSAHRSAVEHEGLLPDPGSYSYRKGGEHHSWEPSNVRALREAASNNDPDAYARFAESEDSAHLFIRDVMSFREGRTVPLKDVESAEDIMRRFVGNDYRFLLPTSAVAGALILLGADSFARLVIAPIILPIGAITSFVGGPIFLWILFKGAKRK